MAIFAMEHATAAAAANTKSLLFELVSSLVVLQFSDPLMALAITTPRRAWVEDCFDTVLVLRNEAVIVMEAMAHSAFLVSLLTFV